MLSQAAQYFERLQRALDVKGTVPSDISETTVPTVLLEDMTLPEHQWARRGRAYFFADYIGAVAAQNGFVCLQNPADSTVLCKISFGNLQSSGAADMLFWQTTASLGAPNPRVQSADGRQELVAAPAADIFSGTAALALPGDAIRLGAQTNWWFAYQDDYCWIVPPGRTFFMANGTVNQVTRCWFRWLEIDLEMSER